MKNIYLIGMMGCGKSTIGPLLAARLEYSFVDTDTKIEELKNRSIVEIFETMGEPEFRQFETESLEKVALNTRQIIATGGGIAISPKNWNYLSQGLTIWLDPSVDILVERLKHETTRPILATSEDLRSKLERLLVERRQWYDRADVHLPITRELTCDAIVDRILEGIVNFR